MPRQSLMKRLSKSASDISSPCTKKSHSNSQDNDNDEEDGEADDRGKPMHQAYNNDGLGQPNGEVKPIGHHHHRHHGILHHIRQRLGSRSSSRDSRKSRRKHRSGEDSQDTSSCSSRSPFTTPDSIRRARFNVEEASTTPPLAPQILRFRKAHVKEERADSDDSVKPEVIRHSGPPVTQMPSLTSAMAQELEMANIGWTNVMGGDDCQSSVDETSSTYRQESADLDLELDPEAERISQPPMSSDCSFHSIEQPMESNPRLDLHNSSSSLSSKKELKEHKSLLKSINFFRLHVHLKQGFDLAARDSNGSSDPYVKFVYKNKVIHKSKTIHKDLNPLWDEQFVLGIDDPFVPLEVKVYDYDWAFRDDFMGEACISLSRLDFDKAQEVLLSLTEAGKSEYLGQLALTVVLEPRRSAPNTTVTRDRSNSIISLLSNVSTHPSLGPQLSRNTRSDSMSKKTKPQSWTAVVNVVLIEGRDLLAMDFEGTSDPYCKFRLGNERYKSKAVPGSLNPKWLEQFDLSLYPDQIQEMEITVWDKDQRSKDDFMGRCSVDLSVLTRDFSHDIWRELEDGAGRLHLLISVSGLTSDFESLETTDELTGQHHLISKDAIPDDKRQEFALRNSLKDLNEVGYLVVKVFCAKGLYAADLGGKSDPFVVLELDNQRVQTHTEYKTVSPTWNRIFTLPVRDINSTLFLTVYDEDRNHTYEFLGKVAIPLLRVESGRRRWYAFKDKKLRSRAKGANSQILLEMDLVWNPIRASFRTLNPKEERYMVMAERFKRQIFLNNVMRIKAVIVEFVRLGKFIESCLEWEHPVRSVIAFASFLVITYYFQPYMFPIGLLLIFLKNYVITSYLESELHHHHHHHHSADENFDDLEDEDLIDKDEEEKEEKKSLKARLQAIQEVTAMVQNALGYVASLMEEVKNTFNFSVPFLSWLAIIILIVVALILYFISLRFLVIVWGINKFTKKLIRPNWVTNNELLDFLSRVPNDEELLDCRELRLHHHDEASATTTTKKGQTQKKKQK